MPQPDNESVRERLAFALADEALRRHLVDALRVALPGERVWLVGGTVRDAALGRVREPLDIDLATTGDPAAFGHELANALGGAYVPLDEERGIVRVVAADGTVFDLASTGGQPIESDLARRDFTIDAIAVDAVALSTESGSAAHPPAPIDPHGGLDDAAAGVIRMVSAEAFADDPLRTLRAFRLAAVLGFRVEAATLAAIRAAAPPLASAAGERLARELFLLLAAPDSTAAVREAEAAGVLDVVLPEIAPMRGVTQNEYHHLDVWEHSLESLACLEDVLAELPALLGDAAEPLAAFLAADIVAERPRTALLKLVALLHDAGKPACREERDGRVIFYGHAKCSGEAVRGACERLRLSSRETAEAVRIAERHLVPADLLATSPLTDKRLARFFRREGEAGLALLLLALADGMATRGPAADPAKVERMRAFVREMGEAYYGWARTRIGEPPLVNGDDLMEALGLAPGPELGRLLDRVRSRQLAGEIATREDALAYAASALGRRPPTARA